MSRFEIQSPRPPSGGVAGVADGAGCLCVLLLTIRDVGFRFSGRRGGWISLSSGAPHNGGLYLSVTACSTAALHKFTSRPQPPGLRTAAYAPAAERITSGVSSSIRLTPILVRFNSAQLRRQKLCCICLCVHKSVSFLCRRRRWNIRCRRFRFYHLPFH